MLVPVAGLVTLVSLAAYTLFAETGPIGWLNAAQSSLFGSYSRGLSMLVLMFGVGIPVVAIWAVVSPSTLARFSQPRTPVIVASPVPARPKAVFGMALGAWLVLVALVWGGICGYDAWRQRSRNEDENASYMPLDLAPGMNDAAAGHRHLAVHGRLLGDHVVSRAERANARSLTMWIPMVERDWHEGDLVHFVVRLNAGDDLALRSALNAPVTDLLARTSASVPTPARLAFQSVQAPLADDALTLLIVPAQNGRPLPAPPAPGYRDLILRGVFGTALVSLFVVFFAAAMLRRARRAG